MILSRRRRRERAEAEREVAELRRQEARRIAREDTEERQRRFEERHRKEINEQVEWLQLRWRDRTCEGCGRRSWEVGYPVELGKTSYKIPQDYFPVECRYCGYTILAARP